MSVFSECVDKTEKFWTECNEINETPQKSSIEGVAAITLNELQPGIVSKGFLRLMGTLLTFSKSPSDQFILAFADIRFNTIKIEADKTR
jgi:hypothetical protein